MRLAKGLGFDERAPSPSTTLPTRSLTNDRHLLRTCCLLSSQQRQAVSGAFMDLIIF